MKDKPNKKVKANMNKTTKNKLTLPLIFGHSLPISAAKPS
jgi:hypothetical protein